MDSIVKWLKANAIEINGSLYILKAVMLKQSMGHRLVTRNYYSTAASLNMKVVDEIPAINSLDESNFCFFMESFLRGKYSLLSENDFGNPVFFL